MPEIHPFPCYCVKPEWAVEVVTPPYDAFSPAERAAFVEDHPGNYLNVIRSLDEFTGHRTLSLEKLLEQNAENLRELLIADKFSFCEEPCLYLYRLISGEHEQTGLVCEISVDAYAAGQSVKVHEQTRREKEDQLLAYMERVGAASSPVCCTYRHQAAIDAEVRDLIQSREPLLDFQSVDGVRHTVWRMADAERIQRMTSLFAALPVSYLTDGHHRAAVAWRYAQQERLARNERYTGEEPFNFLLVAFFPDNQLRILPYNRCVKGLNGLSKAEFLTRLEAHFTVTEFSPRPTEGYLPDRPRRFACLLGDNWYDLLLRSEVGIPDDPVQRLDVSLLQRFILEPVLGIREPRTDPRIGYISGASGEKGLENACRQGFAAAFACYGMSVQELIAVAEAGQIMPPKSTWFDPKARSGLFVRMRNGG